MTLAELAAESGVPARTVRFYIARGLLDGPEVAGRGAAYGTPHLARLRAIREMQQRGMTLTAIAAELSGGGAAAVPGPPAARWQYEVSPDVTVLVRADLAPWRMILVRAALGQLAARLAEKEES